MRCVRFRNFICADRRALVDGRQRSGITEFSNTEFADSERDGEGPFRETRLKRRDKNA